MGYPVTKILGKLSPYGGYVEGYKPTRVKQREQAMRDLDMRGASVRLRVRSDLVRNRKFKQGAALLRDIVERDACKILAGYGPFNFRQRRKAAVIVDVKFTKPEKPCTEPGVDPEFASIIGAECEVSLPVAKIMIGRDKYGILFEEVSDGTSTAQAPQELVHPRVAAKARAQEKTIIEQSVKLDTQRAELDELKEQMARLVKSLGE